MNIVYFIDHLRPEGTQKFLNQLTFGLAARGHLQTVVCLNSSWDEDVVKNLKKHGVSFRILGKVSLISGIGLLINWVWLRNKRFDVAVTLLFVSDVIGRLLAKLAKIPWIVSSIRAKNINYNWIQRWLVKFTMPYANKVVINSENFLDYVVRKEGALREKIFVINNSIDVKEMDVPDENEKLRIEFKIPPEANIIGSVGRLTYQKGLDILIRAFASINAHDSYLLLVGEGEEENALRKLARKLGVDDRVVFTGYRTDVPKILKIIDIYVQPSRWEGMPNSLLEAMAAGCPIIASNVDGINELITHRRNGLLYNPNDEKTLTNFIMYYRDMVKIAAGYAVNSKLIVEHEFNFKKMIDKWEFVLCSHKQ